MSALLSTDRRRLLEGMTLQMRHELVANEHKGVGWRDMPLAEHEHELVYHTVKLILAARAGITDAIREYAADVGNHAAMLADSFGALEVPVGDDEVSYDAIGSQELRGLANMLLQTLTAETREAP